MKTRKLRGYVLPTLYVVLIGCIFLTVIQLGKFLNEGADAGYSYVTKVLMDESIPVIYTDNKEIRKPFTSSDVKISKYFYKKDDDAKKQQDSLIYYENTYMQNTGLLYSAQKEFDVLAVLDGTVRNIKEDNILGMVVEVEHSSKLTTIYQSLGQLNVSVGQTIKQGDKIGVSGTNNLERENEYALHFEVRYNDTLIDPEEFYQMDIKTIGQ